MTEAEFLRRIDGHIELTREHIARGNELMMRNNELMGEVRQEMRLNREERTEGRQFMRDLTRRNELVWKDVRKGLADISEDVRANTAATLSVLDRLA